MEMREFGRTGLKVSVLGLGLAEIPRHGDSTSGVEMAGRVVNNALDGGINFLDTAASYGNTEEMIGRTVAHRRDEYILATKAGLVTGGATGEPWTTGVIEESIDRSLKRLRTDHLDLVQLHSCELEVLQRGEVIDALDKARDAGKTRFIGYSGDNEAARWAVESGRFDSLQTSYNLVEQHARTNKLFELAESGGVGVIIKRPVANGIWGKDSSTYPYADEYFRRAGTIRGMGPLPDEPDDPHLLALGFVLARPEVDTVIVGTHNPDHVRANIELVERGPPISSRTLEELYDRFDQVGQEWRQLT